MLKFNKGFWIAIITGIIAVVVGAGITFFTTDPSDRYVGLIMLAIFAGMFYLFYRLFFKTILNNRRLQKTGISSKAKILAVTDTGVTINNNPQVKLTLEIKNVAGKIYTADAKVLVSRIHPDAYREGMEVPIKVDPKNEKNIALDFTGSSATQQASPEKITAMKDELTALKTEQESISNTGKQAKAIIKKYTWLGAYVNGENPYVELELEVLPDYEPAFSGRTKGVIAKESVPKYQPGKEIFVKYDRYDKTKIAIDHSA
ncbi:MAG: hypothetical protein R2796_07510 [Chitinophagaceae bacterium]|nr:hypothetical protein [Chitinophagaceae bacterium]MCB0740116.1 hypothetical protein [Chitinophagaceae bacterium]HQV05178.1 hypothetical protein [Chitinophagaceae bacterium]